MSTIQDIHALEERIYEAVGEYLHDVKAYVESNAMLHIYQDGDTGEVLAEIESYPLGTKADHDKGIYDLLDDGLIFVTEGTQEPDNDTISEIANSWLFLD